MICNNNNRINDFIMYMERYIIIILFVGACSAPTKADSEIFSALIASAFDRFVMH